MTRPAPREWDQLLGELQHRREIALAGGGAEKIAREHRLGRLSARERVDLFVDPGTFVEYGMLATTPGEFGRQLPSTFLCGTAEIDGRPVAIGVEDFSIEGGGVGVHLARPKGAWGGFIEETALAYEIPLILVLTGAGGSIRLQEMKGYPELLSGAGLGPMFDLLSRVPVVTAVLGPSAGGGAARAVISHFSVMSEQTGCMFAGGPPLVKQATGATIDKFELGGTDVHVRVSGLIDQAAIDEEDAVDQIRLFLSYLPTNVWELAPRALTGDPVDRPIDDVLTIVSPDERTSFDPLALIDVVADQDSFFELRPDYGQSLRTGFARIDGYPMGVLASDPRHSAGALDRAAAEKQERFVNVCNVFHLPVVYFVDVPGFMVGPEAERSGLLRAGSRALYAIQSATVPVFTIQVRRSFGLAAQATGSANPHSVRLAWPTGKWGDMPVGGGVEAIHRAEIEAAPDPAALRKELTEKYAAQASAWRGVERFGVEEMIDPRETRVRLAGLLSLARRVTRPGPKTGPPMLI